jgi:hypothetical protein
MNYFLKIGVIGTGTAGITTLSHLLAWLPETCTVTSISDPNSPILGIGESTTTSIPESLYYGTDLNFAVDKDLLDSTVKHGVKYVNWRDSDFYTVIPPPHYAMHFDNFKLKEVCFKKFKDKWGDKFSIINGTIDDINNQPDVISCFIDNKQYQFDYLIDCRGYPNEYDQYDLLETIPVNHCLVHTVQQPGEWPYTYHMATPDGWMFGIPLQTRQGWGYLYNDKITTREEALSNQAKMLNISAEELNTREFSFKNYKAKKFIEGRLIKNGNRALFYEPLEALSGWFYDRVIRAFVDYAVIGNYTADQANLLLSDLAEDYELFICYMYQGGSKFKSKFWETVSERSQVRLKSSKKFQKNIEFIKKVRTEHYANSSVIMPFPYKTWKQLDNDLGYHYFSSDS